MKRILTLLLSVGLLLGLSACTGKATNGPTPSNPSAPAGSNSSTETKQPENSTKVLVAYFSRAGENPEVGKVKTGNTRRMAEMIAAQSGGELLEIKPAAPYPESYSECADMARQEKEQNARPALSGLPSNLNAYHTVFIGYPIWWGDMPMAVYTFLESYQFAGKTVIPFCTHEGSGFANTEQTIKNLCAGAAVLSGLELRGSTAQFSKGESELTITKWLEQINFNTASQ